MLLPAFHRRKKDAGAVGRLIAGYGELELGLAKCVGMALALERNPPTAAQKISQSNWFFACGAERKGE
jgi:hypothetical protein